MKEMWNSRSDQNEIENFFPNAISTLEKFKSHFETKSRPQDEEHCLGLLEIISISRWKQASSKIFFVSTMPTKFSTDTKQIWIKVMMKSKVLNKTGSITNQRCKHRQIKL